MRSVIGLYPYKNNVDAQIQLVEEAGFTRERMRVITQGKPIRCLLGCDPTRIVTRYATWGALLGILVYGVFILVAAWCDCMIYSINQLLALEIVIGGVLAGAVVGGLLGVFIGLAEYEKDTHLYLQGVNIGEKIFVLDAEIEEAERAIDTLKKLGCLGVKLLPN